jgi:hypothetical protein
MNFTSRNRQTITKALCRPNQFHNINFVLFVGALVLLALFSWTTPAYAHEAATPGAVDDSLALEGLRADPQLCSDGYRIADTSFCTHGPDAHPPGFAPDALIAPAEGLVQASAVVCDGDGVSGQRVQLLYVRAEDAPDRYAEYLASFRQWAWDMDEIFEKSAQKTGGHRRIRFVTEPDCQLSIPHVVVESGGNDSFQRTISALINQGYNNRERKYIAFVEARVYCGIGTVGRDPNPSPDNWSNHRADYARIDASCWSGSVAAHELVHNLGGIQPDAPNASGGWHCTDEYDLMCYSDAPLYPSMQYLCPISHSKLLDCNDDDYFHTHPATGSYLATHWNVANSAFLIARDELQNEPPTIELVTLTGMRELVAPAAITVTANVSDSDGIVTMVEFYRNEIQLVQLDTAPFTYQWEEVVSGTYTITAKVYDDLGASALSAPLTIQVTSKPTQPPGPDEDESRRLLAPIYLPMVVRK